MIEAKAKVLKRAGLDHLAKEPNVKHYTWEQVAMLAIQHMEAKYRLERYPTELEKVIDDVEQIRNFIVKKYNFDPTIPF